MFLWWHIMYGGYIYHYQADQERKRREANRPDQPNAKERDPPVDTAKVTPEQRKPRIPEDWRRD